MHNQALVALGLVSALQCCADAYVCSEALRSPELAGGSAEAHIRAINLTLLRLQPRIDPFDELRADMQARSLLLPLRLCHQSTVVFKSDLKPCRHAGEGSLNRSQCDLPPVSILTFSKCTDSVFGRQWTMLTISV